MFAISTKAAKLFMLSITATLLSACAASVATIPSHSFNNRVLQKVGDTPNMDGWCTLQFRDEREGLIVCSNKIWRTANGGEGWELVYSTNHTEPEIKAVTLSNSGIDWMLKGNKVFKTADKGKSWLEQSILLDLGSEGQLRSLELSPNGETIWLAGEAACSVSPSYLRLHSSTTDNDGKECLTAIVLKSSDGGKTWYPQASFEGRSNKILQVTFRDEKHGLALGDSAVFYTEDGGNHWSLIDFNEGCVNQPFMETAEGHPADVYFVDSNKGWLTYTDGYVATSNDGGKTWCDLLHPKDVWAEPSYDSFFRELYFTNTSDGWALGADGSLYGTQNGGKTWFRTNEETKFVDIYFSHDTGWALSKDGLFRLSL